MLVLHTLLPPERLPLLVTGISGVAGFNALAYFQQRYPGQVIGVRPTQTWQLVGSGIEALDTEDRDGMLRSVPEAWLPLRPQHDRQLRPEIVRTRPEHGPAHQRRQAPPISST